ncbi:MAG TPA: hypothetical protein VJN48_13320 [Terriglobales bacterium]|jgi:hypothetical protein|nr:hypothetical protein [Terriglobales bacterium]
MNGDRVRFITHRGQRILLVEYDGCTAAQFSTICDLVPSYVTAEPKGSVLLLADFTNAQMDREGLEHLKKATVFDRPHLKRSAWVVTNGFPKAFYENVKAFSVRDLPTFNTREQALSYLVAEDEDETRELASPA